MDKLLMNIDNIVLQYAAVTFDYHAVASIFNWVILYLNIIDQDHSPHTLFQPFRAALYVRMCFDSKIKASK